MNCANARSHLPLLTYGDLAPDEARAVQQHLAGCPECRREFACLQEVRHALDAVPAPAVRVDLPRLYQEAAARQARRARRWRRAALAGLAVAALVVLAFGLRLQVRVEAHQVVLAWGTALAAADVVPPAPRQLPPADRPDPAEVERRLQLASSLIHALADDLESRDAQQQESIKRLQVRLDTLQAQSGARWTETRRDIAALYTAQFGPNPKGE
jgi:hypothetical protein